MRQATGLSIGFGILAVLASREAFAQETAPPQKAPGAAQSSTPSKNAGVSEKRKRRLHLVIGPQWGAYRPNTAKVANRFGGEWKNFGLALGNIDAPKPGLRLTPEFNFMTAKSGDNRVYMAPLQLGGRQTWKVGNSFFYTGLTGGMTALNLKAVPEGVNAGWRFTPSLALTGGTNLSRRAYLELEYHRMGSVRGFNFSGVNINSGFRF